MPALRFPVFSQVGVRLKFIIPFLFLLPVRSGNTQVVSSATQQLQSHKPQEVGMLYQRHYAPKEYAAAFQNWGGFQDKQGVMFFSNSDGVLMFDGKAWSLIQTPSQSVIRSMAVDENGKIYVGALDDFGYLEQQKNGKRIYKSLLDKVKPDLHSMGNIWQTHVVNNAVYFESETGLFCWNGEKFSFWPWPDPQAYHFTFVWKDNIFLQEIGKGVMVLKNDSFSLIQHGEYFKNIRIYNTLPFGKDELQLATQYDGLFLYDGVNFRKVKTEADAFFKSNQIYCGVMLTDGSYVYGTRHGGAIIMDQYHNIRYLLNNENGLPTNIILGLLRDQEDNLWLCLDNGLSKVEVNNHLSLFNTKNGLDGSINNYCRYNDKLYVTTNTGLYVLKQGDLPRHHAYFEKIPEINMSCWGLLKIADRMLIGSNMGLFEMVGGKLHKIMDAPSYAIHQLKGDSSRIIVAQSDRLRSLKFSKGRWHETGYIPDIFLDDISFSETNAGKLWLGTYSQGAVLIMFPEKNGVVDYDNHTLTFLNEKNGLPEGYFKIYSIGNEEIFSIGITSRIFHFDYSSNQFKEDTAFAKKFGLKIKHTFPASDEDSAGRFFFKTKDHRQLILVTPSGNSFTHTYYDVSRIFEHVHVNSFLENNIMWNGGADGIVRYELTESSPSSNRTFHAHLNKIILPNDSVLFQGIGGLTQNLILPHSLNSLRFEFTATNFAAAENNEFQYMLEGYDDGWSSWSSENIKEYNRLWEGNYKFLVRSKNYAQQVGTTAEFAFSISPPWYRTFYAYTVYFIGAAVFVWGLVRWRLQRVLKEKEALQAEVALQTQEIRQQNIQLAEQSEELKTNAEQLKALDKMKSNFFVNISHEFRTPLSLILSPLEKYIDRKETNDIRLTELERMHRNAKRLQQLINQLLDLAKLESGGMKLNLQRSDFIYFLRVLTSSFESLAESRNIQFEVSIQGDAYETFFDHDKVETVLYNLLSNAFKFTPDGGRISLQVILPSENSDEPVSISISDTGPGIPANEIDKIFDRFYQVDSSSAREFEGSGIGLSLVKELVQLMKGTIRVESRVGQGSTFCVQLSLKRAADQQVANDQNFSASENMPAVEQMTTTEVSVLGGNENEVADALILVVEDNADLRSFLTENLEQDYQIAIAENGSQGFDKALELIPDLIVSDMMMPVMDGFTLCTKIRADERTSHIPFILLTARTSIENKLEGLELGADEYMTKPFNIKEVKVRIRNLLEQRKNLRRSFSREVTVQPKNISVTSVDERFLNHALEIMEAHLSDQQFSVERFAEEIGMSRKNLLRKITALTDQSVNEFIRNFRLQRAAQLLAGKSGTVSEVAYQVGFNNLSYFSKCFKELFGVLPNEYVASGSKSHVSSFPK